MHEAVDLWRGFLGILCFGIEVVGGGRCEWGEGAGRYGVLGCAWPGFPQERYGSGGSAIVDSERRGRGGFFGDEARVEFVMRSDLQKLMSCVCILGCNHLGFGVRREGEGLKRG